MASCNTLSLGTGVITGIVGRIVMHCFLPAPLAWVTGIAFGGLSTLGMFKICEEAPAIKIIKCTKQFLQSPRCDLDFLVGNCIKQQCTNTNKDTVSDVKTLGSNAMHCLEAAMIKLKTCSGECLQACEKNSQMHYNITDY